MSILSARNAGPLLMMLALTLRVLAVQFHPISRSLFADMDNYRRIADAILLGDWAPAHFLPAIGHSDHASGDGRSSSRPCTCRGSSSPR